MFPAIALSTAKKGQKITVRLPNGKTRRLIAGNDIVSTNVLVLGDVVISNDASQLALNRTTQLFESKTKVDGAYYPYFTVIVQNNKLIGIYGENAIAVLPLNVSNVNAVNLNYFGNNLYTVVLLSGNKGIAFKDKSIPPIEKIFTTSAKLTGNVAWAYNLLPLFQQPAIIDIPPTNEIPPVGIEGNAANWGKWRYIYADPYNFLGEQEYPNIQVLIQASYAPDFPVYYVLPSSTDFTTELINFIYQVLANPSAPNPQVVNYNIPSAYSIGIVNNQVSKSLNFTSQGTNFCSMQVTRDWQFENRVESTSTDEIDREYLIQTSGAENLDTSRDMYTSPPYTLNNYTDGFITKKTNKYGNQNQLRSAPVILNDYQTVYSVQQTNHSYSWNSESKTVWTRVSFGSAWCDVEKSEGTGNLIENKSNRSFIVIFNKGEIGLYQTTFASSVLNYTLEVDRLPGSIQERLVGGQPIGVNPLENGDTRIVNGTSLYRHESQAVDLTYEPSVYKLAYKTTTITIDNPGWLIYANSNNLIDSKIAAFASGNQEDRVFTWVYGRKQITEYASKKTITSTLNYGDLELFNNLPTIITKTISTVPNNAICRSFKEDDLIVVLTKFNNNAYLAICEITDVIYTNQTTISDPYLSLRFNNKVFVPNFESKYHYVTTLTLNIIKAKKIKLFTGFLNYSTLFFPVRGAEIFNNFDKGRISFFEKPSSTPGETRKFLAVTMLPISQYNTQSLVFEIIDNNIVFLDVMGGEVVDSQKNPTFANQWVQYYPEETPKNWSGTAL